MNFNNIVKSQYFPNFSIFITAFCIRLAIALLINPPLLSDELDYLKLGQSIVTGNGFALDGNPTASRAPGYPLVISSLFSFWNNSIIAVRVFQACIDSMTCFLIFLISRKMFSLSTAYAAAIVYAVYPGSMVYVLFFLTETFFSGLFLATMFLAVSSRYQSSKIWNVLFGVLLGVMTLVKPNAALLLIVFFAWEWHQSRTLLIAIKKYVLMGIGFVLIVSPWMVRNQLQFNHFSLTSNGGVNFWIGHNEQATGSFRYNTENNPVENVSGEFERSQFALKEGVKFIITHPVEEITLTGLKFVHFFEPDFALMQSLFYKDKWKTYSRAIQIYREFPFVVAILLHMLTAGIIILALWTFMFATDSTSRYLSLLKFLIVGWICIHLLFFSVARFRIPIMPAMIMMAAYTFEAWRSKLYVVTTIRIISFGLISTLLVGSWIVIFGMIYL